MLLVLLSMLGVIDGQTGGRQHLAVPRQSLAEILSLPAPPVQRSSRQVLAARLGAKGQGQKQGRGQLQGQVPGDLRAERSVQGPPASTNSLVPPAMALRLARQEVAAAMAVERAPSSLLAPSGLPEDTEQQMAMWHHLQQLQRMQEQMVEQQQRRQQQRQQEQQVQQQPVGPARLLPATEQQLVVWKQIQQQQREQEELMRMREEEEEAVRRRREQVQLRHQEWQGRWGGVTSKEENNKRKEEDKRRKEDEEKRRKHEEKLREDEQRREEEKRREELKKREEEKKREERRRLEEEKRTEEEEVAKLQSELHIQLLSQLPPAVLRNLDLAGLAEEVNIAQGRLAQDEQRTPEKDGIWSFQFSEIDV